MKNLLILFASSVLSLSLTACASGSSSSSSSGSDNGNIVQPNQITPLTGGGTVSYLTTPENISPEKSIVTEVAVNGIPDTVYTITYDIGLQMAANKLQLQANSNLPSVVTTPSPCVITGSGVCQVNIGSGNAYDGVYAIISKVTVNGTVVSNNEPLLITVTGAPQPNPTPNPTPTIDPLRYQKFAAMASQQMESITQSSNSATSLLLPQQTIAASESINYYIVASDYSNPTLLYWSVDNGQTLKMVNLTAKLQQGFPSFEVTSSSLAKNDYAVSSGIYFTAETTGSYPHTGYIFFYNPVTDQLNQVAEKADSVIYELTRNGSNFVAMNGGFYNTGSGNNFVSTYSGGSWTDLVTNNQFESYDFYGLSIINGQITISGLLETSWRDGGNSQAVFSYNNGTWSSWASRLPVSDTGIVLSTVQAANGDIYIASLKNGTGNWKPCPSSNYGSGTIMKYHNGSWSTISIPLLNTAGVNMMQLTTSLDGGVYANINYNIACGGNANSYSVVALN